MNALETHPASPLFAPGSELFRQLIESAPDAMVIVNQSGTILIVNARAEALFGYAREDLLGKPIETLVPERFRSQHRAHRVVYFEEPRARPMGSDLDLRGLRRDGSEFPVEILITIVEELLANSSGGRTPPAPVSPT
jgi:PAS domain S-box-containing protein